MENKIYILRFRAAGKDIFEAIKLGRKKVETRAATEKYRKIGKGDKVCLVCGREKFTKRVVAARVFLTIAALLKKYRPSQINPKIKTTTIKINLIFPIFPKLYLIQSKCNNH